MGRAEGMARLKIQNIKLRTQRDYYYNYCNGGSLKSLRNKAFIKGMLCGIAFEFIVSLTLKMIG